MGIDHAKFFQYNVNNVINTNFRRKEIKNMINHIDNSRGAIL